MLHACLRCKVRFRRRVVVLQREDRDGAVRPGGFAPVLVAVGDGSISAAPGVQKALAQPCRVNSAAVQNDTERALFM